MRGGGDVIEGKCKILLSEMDPSHWKHQEAWHPYRCMPLHVPNVVHLGNPHRNGSLRCKTCKGHFMCVCVLLAHMQTES